MPLFLSRPVVCFVGCRLGAARVHQAALGVGLIPQLVERGLLIEHWTATPPEGTPSGVSTDLILEVRRVPVVSYPYEWSFTMLRDAALLTLNVTEACFRAGFQMKDATAYNGVFDGRRPVMIDLTSIEQGFDGLWTAYGQFCDHFLAPFCWRRTCLCLFSLMYADGWPVYR